MKKRRKGCGIRLAIVILVIALIAVAGVIVWKQIEYRSSQEFYEGLRGALTGWAKV